LMKKGGGVAGAGTPGRRYPDGRPHAETPNARMAPVLRRQVGSPGNSGILAGERGSAACILPWGCGRAHSDGGRPGGYHCRPARGARRPGVSTPGASRHCLAAPSADARGRGTARCAKRRGHRAMCARRGRRCLRRVAGTQSPSARLRGRHGTGEPRCPPIGTRKNANLRSSGTPPERRDHEAIGGLSQACSRAFARKGYGPVMNQP
jgi:hypothetical protein